MHGHVRGAEEDQAGGGGRHAGVRHGQVRHHPPARDVPRPLQAHLPLHGLGPARGGDARRQRSPHEDHGVRADGPGEARAGRGGEIMPVEMKSIVNELHNTVIILCT